MFFKAFQALVLFGLGKRFFALQKIFCFV